MDFKSIRLLKILNEITNVISNTFNRIQGMPLTFLKKEEQLNTENNSK